MSAITDAHAPPAAPATVNFDNSLDIRGLLVFLAILAGGLFFMAYSIYSDISVSGAPAPTTVMPYILLGVAMLIALGFEFVNGFHDTANAVATTSIRPHLSARPAICGRLVRNVNFLGVLTSTARSLSASWSPFPVELILQVGSSAGFAMVFALLIAAIIWNSNT